MDILNAMTSEPEPKNETDDVLVNILSDSYLTQILPFSQGEDYQAEITRQREGELTMENLMKLDFKRFLLIILAKAGSISIDRFRSMIEIYCTKNKVKMNGKEPHQITCEDVARDIHFV